MGVLNVTPDSFFDGGTYIDSAMAIAHALDLQNAGADILDVGGESTRPGAEPITAEEELARVLPVLEGLRGELHIPISLDTRRATVAEAGIAMGAEIINTVHGRENDPDLLEVARRTKAGVVLMHMRGKPATMQHGPFARDVLRDVASGLRRALQEAAQAGIPKSKILVDPGIGFGKRYSQNFELLARLPEISRLDFPLVVGTSRKAFLGWALRRKDEALWPADQRQWGTAATVSAAILGGAHVVRVHDVNEMAQIARVTDAILSKP